MYQCPYGNDPIDSYLRRFYGARYTPETLVHESYVADKCESCEFVFQRFVPNPEMLTTIYESWLSTSEVAPNYPSKKQLRSGRDAHEIMTFARSVRKPIETLDVFDFGMGWGLWCKAAIAAGCKRVIGFDLADSRVEHARLNGIQTRQVQEIENQSLDFINTEQVFEQGKRKLWVIGEDLVA